MAHRHYDKATRLRKRLSALLYVSLAIVSIAICALIVVANPTTMVNAFVDARVVVPLQEDVAQYADDMCQKNNIPNDFVEDVFTYDRVYQLEKAYVSGTLGGSKQYNQDAFGGLLDELKEQLEKDVSAMIADYGIRIDKNADEDAVSTFVDGIVKYVDGRIDFDYMNNVKHSFKIIRALSYLAIAVFGIIGAVAVILMISKGGKNYRVVRSCAYSVLGASFLDLFMLIVVALVKATKDLIIYPLYIADGFMNYVNSSMMSFGRASALLFTVFLCLAVVVWKMKRNEKG